MRSLSRLAIALFLGPACTPVSCESAAEPRAEAVAPDESAGRWPRALVADLPLATPATEVTLERDRAGVSNSALVATWPAPALERARRSAPGGDPAWPLVDLSVDAPDGDDPAIAVVRDLLVRARSAERAGSEGGTGAGAFNLRVASDVPFGRVERVLYAAAQAGYGAPRVLLATQSDDRMLPWPSAPPRPAPTREQIEAAMRGAPLADPIASEPRARLDSERVTLGTCELEGPLDVRALERCAARERARGDAIALDVDRDLPFARVAAALQALTRVFASVRVTSVRPT